MSSSCCLVKTIFSPILRIIFLKTKKKIQFYFSQKTNQIQHLQQLNFLYLVNHYLQYHHEQLLSVLCHKKKKNSPVTANANVQRHHTHAITNNVQFIRFRVKQTKRVDAVENIAQLFDIACFIENLNGNVTITL